MSNYLEQLADLVKIKSVTGEEQEIIRTVSSMCKDLGLPFQANENGIIITIGTKASPSLVMCSHLDTVVAGNNWNADPFSTEINNGVLIGRGAVDAKASCLSMIHTAYTLQKQSFSGCLHVLLSVGEEGNFPSLPMLLDRITNIDAGIIGEPTLMNIATSQRGLLVAELLAKGNQEHAARSRGKNAIEILCEEILKLKSIELPKHDRLGQIKITPTRLNAGIADNVTPNYAIALLDIRTTPVFSHNQILQILADNLNCEVKNIADIWIPCETPPDSDILRAACKTFPDGSSFASETTSDWVFLEQRNIPAVKIGPGNPEFSHQVNEQISVTELENGINGYIEIAKKYLKID